MSDEPARPGGIEPWDTLTDAQRADAIKAQLDRIEAMVKALHDALGGSPGRGLGH